MQGSLTRLARSIVPLLAGSVLCVAARADISITLNNDFIEKYKNKATISTQCEIMFAHPKAKTAKEDGDIHASADCDEVGLAMVAEVQNAKSQTAAVKFINKVKGTGERVPVIGVWRIWTEHGGDLAQAQGGPVEISNTNPDHIFEIHPVTHVGEVSTLSSLKPIAGFQTKDAAQAFTTYEGVHSKIIAHPDNTTTIVTRMAGYNYVEFRIQLLEDPTHDLEDGLTVFASVKDLAGELLVRKRRMVFVNGSAPEKAVRKLTQGKCMHVLGIPRISLALVSWRVEHAAKNTDVLDWGLPYEIVIVGDYKDNKCGEE